MKQLPLKRMPAEQVLDTMRAARDHDVHWQEGRVFSLVFFAGDEVLDLLKQAYSMFFSENGLNPMAFPSLKKFESEVVSMTASLLGGDDETAGNMTSGGTESLLLAVKTARDWARQTRPAITLPEMILPVTAHPAFDKAAHYFSVKSVHVPVDSNFRAEVDAVRAAITPNTILLVGSAPSYPQGALDPIADLGRLAREHDLLLHVDACVGGMLLPFARKLGYPVADFDLSVPGVTSISADLHKYGYAAKGASVILYKTRALRRHQFYVHTDWPGGIYPSPTMLGTRPGGGIAAAWAVMNFLGEEGYLSIAETVLKTATKIKNGINALDGLKVLGDPVMSVMAIGAKGLNVYEVGDEMSARGWYLDRQQFPSSLHVTINYAHAASADRFLEDLERSVAQARQWSWGKFMNSLQVGLVEAATRVLPEKTVSDLTQRASALMGKGGGLPTRSAAMYGMMASLPNRGDVNEIVLDLLDGMTRVEDRAPDGPASRRVAAE
ncbi:MAG: aspartate aminotransferase family protein [Anaerolineae bacterium]